MVEKLLSPARSTQHTLRSYNGFDHAARKASVPFQNEAFLTGTLRRPVICSVCGFSDPKNLDGRGYIFAHLEDYRWPLDILPCCKSCHAVLHSRFVRPMPFLLLLQRHGYPSCWFGKLTMDASSQDRAFDQTYPFGLPGPWPAKRSNLNGPA